MNAVAVPKLNDYDMAARCASGGIATISGADCVPVSCPNLFEEVVGV